jgi:hypothetical protein
MRQAFWSLLILLTACGDAAPPVQTVPVLSDSVLASLPVLSLTEGQVVCHATGVDGCPLRSAVANRVEDDRIVLWEPGFAVRVFAPGDSVGAPIGRAGQGGQYRFAVAATQLGRDQYRLILAGEGWRAIDINHAGEISRTVSIPDPGPLSAIGYVGNQLVRQRMDGWNSPEGGRLTVTLLRSVEDSTGSTLLDVPLPWLTGGTPDGPPLPPLITSSPAWTLTSDGDVVWSPGDRLTIEKRSPSGEVRWRIEGPPGPRVSDEELEARESGVRVAAQGMPYVDEDYREMRARSDTLHSAVSGIAVSPDGDVFVARTVFSNGEMIEYLRLDPSGVPNGRFAIEKQMRVLLAERDSLLVHMPTESEPWQVRWMRLQ